MGASTVSAPFVYVHPRLTRRGGTQDRRRFERYVARIDVEIKSHRGERTHTIDVSREGLLVRATKLPPLKQPLMLALALPDGPLLAMAVVVRHAIVDGQPAMGLKLLSLPRQSEARWLRAIMQLAEVRKSDALVACTYVEAPLPRPTEYRIVGEVSFDIDVVEEE